MHAERRPDHRSRLRRTGTNVVLEALGLEHHPLLHDALTAPAVASTWRTRGHYVPTHEWEAFLTTGLAIGAVAFDHHHQLVGLVEIRDHDGRDRVAQLSAAASPAFTGSGLVLEAVVLLLDDAFVELDLEKVLVVLSESSLQSIGGGRLVELLEVEGVLRRHALLEGRRQDLTLAAMHREAFVALVDSSSWVASLAPSGWRVLGGRPGLPRRPAALDRVAALLDRPSEGLTLDAPLRAAELDSLTVLELVAEIEGAVGHAVAPELLASLETVGDYLAWLEAPAGSRGSASDPGPARSEGVGQ